MISIRKTMTVLCFIALFITSCSTQEVLANPITTSFAIPAKVQFAGNTIDLDRYDMRERFDREQTQIAYMHTTTLLIMKRANRLFPIIEPILKKYGIPDDFKYLAVIESSLDVRALSPAQAAGLWQLMPRTATELGLEVGDEVDERYHIEKSTEAACKYLRSAFVRYKDWTMAAVSYNAGMGKVSSELEKQLIDNTFDMWLVPESSRYMFRILATKHFFENPRAFGYRVEKEHLYQDINTKKVSVSGSIPDLATWAKQNNITYAQLKEFNMWLRDRKLTNSRGKTYEIDVPDANDMSHKKAKIKVHIKI